MITHCNTLQHRCQRASFIKWFVSADDNTLQHTATQMSAGKFYKMVRECRLLDTLVTQDQVSSCFKQVIYVVRHVYMWCVVYICGV